MTDSKKTNESLIVIRYQKPDKTYAFTCLYAPDYKTERDFIQNVSETCSQLYLHENKIVWVKLFGDSSFFVK